MAKQIPLWKQQMALYWWLSANLLCVLIRINLWSRIFFWCNLALFFTQSTFSITLFKNFKVALKCVLKCLLLYFEALRTSAALDHLLLTSENKHLTAINTIHLLNFFKSIIEWKHLLRKFEVQNVSKQIPDAVAILLYMIYPLPFYNAMATFNGL